MVFLNYGSLLPLFCLGQRGSPKAVDPEPKDQATLLLLQVSAVSPMGQEWHLVPDLEPSDSSLPTRGEDVLSLTLYPQAAFLVPLLKDPTPFPQ